MNSKNSMLYYKEGMRDGIPIGLGYLAVSFSLGIYAKTVGLNAIQGFFASFFTIASAGEYAGFREIEVQASYLELAVMMIIVNLRYLLMSCVLSQKTDPKCSIFNRILIGTFITDELFALNIRKDGYLKPVYTLGMATTTVLPWALGTFLGIIAGNILPDIVVSALSVALYGMFIAIIIPPAKDNKVVAVTILISFALSYFCGIIPGIKTISEGLRTIFLTLLIASSAALFFPVKEDKDNA